MDAILRREFADPVRAALQERIARRVEADPETFLTRFVALPQSFGGRFISADLFKETFDEYRGSTERREVCNSPAHNAAAALAAEQFRRVLLLPAQDDARAVELVTGVSGAGKTSAILERGRLPDGVHAVFEVSLASREVAEAKIRQILVRGFMPVIVAVHVKPEQALENTLRRQAAIGRGADLDAMAATQAGLPEGLRRVREQFADAVKLQLIDRREFSRPVQLDGWERLPVLESEGGHERIKKRLSEHLERLRPGLEEAAYRQAAGTAPLDRGAAGREHGAPEQRRPAQGNREAAVLTPGASVRHRGPPPRRPSRDDEFGR